MNDIDIIRKLIVALIELYDPDFVHHGCPSSESCWKVRQDVIGIIAKSEWRKAGCPKNLDLTFWIMGEKKYEQAIHCWTS